MAVTERDNRTVRKSRLRFVFHKTTTQAAWTSSDVLLKNWWVGHLEKHGVRYRSPKNCRHTFASQVLSTGVAPVEWIAEYMGHTTTAMIHLDTTASARPTRHNRRSPAAVKHKRESRP